MNNDDIKVQQILRCYKIGERKSYQFPKAGRGYLNLETNFSCTDKDVIRGFC